MRGSKGRRWLGGIALAGLLVAVAAARSSAQVGDDPVTLKQQAETLYRLGKFAEAVPIAQKLLALTRTRSGEEAQETAVRMIWLADLFRAQERYGEAEPLYKRAVTILEKVLGPGNPALATPLNDHALTLYYSGKPGEALRQARRALDIREKALPTGHPNIITSLFDVGLYSQQQGNLADAEAMFLRCLELREKTLPSAHPDIAHSLSGLGALRQIQGRLDDAEQLYKRALDIREKALPAGNRQIAVSLNNLAYLYQTQGRATEAEPMHKRALAIWEKALAPNDPQLAWSLVNLGILYLEQGRYRDAEPLQRRALEIRETALPAGHPDIARSLVILAVLHEKQRRLSEAEVLYQRALTIFEKALPQGHPDIATCLSNLAIVYDSQGRLVEAEQLYSRALEMREKALPPGHPEIAAALSNLGILYRRQGLFAKAERAMLRALNMNEKALPPFHLTISKSLGNLATLNMAQRRWEAAYSYLVRDTDILVARMRRDSRSVAQAGERSSGAASLDLSQASFAFSDLIKVGYQLSAIDTARKSALADESFSRAQWGAAPEAAASLAQMAARSAANDPKLAQLVRERQDLIGEWKTGDNELLAASILRREKRNELTEKALRDKIVRVNSRLADIEKALGKQFPQYAAISSPEPLSIDEARQLLKPDEALVLVLDTRQVSPDLPEESFIWVVTRTKVVWERSELGTSALTREVAALRCGLDYLSAWRATDSTCKELTGTAYTHEDYWAGKDLPFDPVRAHNLYKSLFGGVEDLIKGKHLLMVLSGPLTQLPLHVLVTAKPARKANGIAWFARSNAITVLPAVSSLKALRQNAKPSSAKEPFIGFGNPVLVGQPSCGTVTIPETCPEDEVKLASASMQITRARPSSAVTGFYRNGLADVAAVRALCPLPDTAFELNCVAKSLAAPASSIVLGKEMTESALKNAPLDRYRVIHFATHGLLAGETAMLSQARAEPALVMSPPDVPTHEDDGLLTSSEIAALKLDADWVVMSACNTAGGGEQGSEALSGLARAFFYAGARALLVSHWPVNSYAATMLTSNTFAQMRKDPAIGRSEAFRRAMLSLMSDGNRPWAAHPSVWAPFIVVGEGGSNW